MHKNVFDRVGQAGAVVLCQAAGESTRLMGSFAMLVFYMWLVCPGWRCFCSKNYTNDILSKICTVSKCYLGNYITGIKYYL